MILLSRYTLSIPSELQSDNIDKYFAQIVNV